MTHKGYFEHIIGGQSVYKCCFCPYDSFIEQNARIHAETHLTVELPEDPLELGSSILKGKRVVISLLTWNNELVGEQAAQAIDYELRLLQSQGAEACGVLVDNGSDRWNLPDLKEEWLIVRNKSNVGQGPARNQALDIALDRNADYWIMLDGDIIVVPGSASALVRKMSIDLTGSGCLGLYSYNCTENMSDPAIAKYCHEIPNIGLRYEPGIAWTQYGCFNMEPFRKGIRFREDGPFAGPGWGLEDDELWMQLVDAGYRSANTTMFRYMHLKRHSGLAMLDPSLAAKLFDERKRWIVSRWDSSDIPEIAERCRIIDSHRLPDIG